MSFDSPNPYAASSTQPTVPKKSNTLLYILLGVGGILLVSCLGCGGLVYVFGTQGMKMVTAKIQPQVQADPVIREHIGEIKEFTWSITSFAKEYEKNSPRHEGRDVCFEVKGDKGEGLVMCRIDNTNPQNQRITNAELVLPNGEFHKMKD
jgi:hypothetical protein